jgi:hypothetical protein
MTKRNNRWFQPGEPLNWEKTDSQATRRRNALRSRKGDYLATARALQALANVTRDKMTKIRAHSDALYFYAQHKKHSTKKG